MEKAKDTKKNTAQTKKPVGKSQPAKKKTPKEPPKIYAWD